MQQEDTQPILMERLQRRTTRSSALTFHVVTGVPSSRLDQPTETITGPFIVNESNGFPVGAAARGPTLPGRLVRPGGSCGRTDSSQHSWAGMSTLASS